MLERLLSLRRIGGTKTDHPLADSRELRRIIGDIPADNTFKAIDEIIGWLESLQGTRDFPEDRLYEALSRLDDAAQPHLRRQARDYLHAPRLSRAEEKRLWTIHHGFWSLLASGYERCLQALGQKTRVGEQIRQVLPALTARLISALAGVLKWEQFHYGPAAGGLWQRLGAALLAAEGAGVAGRSLQLREGVSGVSSPQQEFVKAVAFQAASMGSLLPLEIELAERLIAHFLPGFVFSATAQADSVYWVDLAQPAPPMRLARMPSCATPTQRFFKPGTAHAAIEKLLHDLELGHDVPGDLALGGQYHARALLPALRHLAAYLAPVPPQRRHDRHNVKQRALVVHGLNDVRLALAGKLAGQPGQAGEPPVESWIVENVSRGGFGALVNNIPGEWLKIGALLALQPEGGATWLVGIVRRYQRMGDAGVQVGVELLALQVTPIELKTRAASTYAAAAGMPALLLRDGNAPGEVRIVMPFASFSLRETLEYEQDGRRIPLSPVAIGEQAADYELARFRPLAPA